MFDQLHLFDDTQLLPRADARLEALLAEWEVSQRLVPPGSPEPQSGSWAGHLAIEKSVP